MDASTQTAAPNNQPANPPFIRSGHLTAPGFSEHRIYWEEYGSLAGDPVIVMHGLLGGQRGVDHLLRFADDGLQVSFVLEAFGVDLIDGFGA